jgi:hypothetical protein
MHQLKVKIFLFLVYATTGLNGQAVETSKPIDNEIKMTFPSIYFKHNSLDYALMPYTVDSCYKYIANNINDISDFVIWRDSKESKYLSSERIKKLKIEINKYTPSSKIDIEIIGNGQKVTQRTINEGMDENQIQYLLSLNSVFDIARTGSSTINKLNKRNHKFYPKIWCWKCWKSGFHIKYRRDMRKSEKQNKKPIKNA